MKSLESAGPEIHVAGDVDKRIRDILDSPPLNDYVRRQMQLAVERFGLEHPNDTIDHETLEQLMMAWSDKESPSHYSEAWKNLAYHPDFEKHPRFQGDYSKVTLEDLEAFIKNGSNDLPE